ncbi:MAG: class I SAM-dependent methyltransferase, partial [Sedimentisphaerales bacterium]
MVDIRRTAVQKNHEQTNKKISTNPDGEVGRHVDISAGEVDKGIGISCDKDLARIESKRRKNPGYYREIDRSCTFIVPEGVRVLELGCATGRLLAATRPSYGLGIDIDAEQIAAARQLHGDQSKLEFQVGDVEDADFSGMEPFDYIIISDLLSLLHDVQKTLERLQAVCAPHTRLIITYHSN